MSSARAVQRLRDITERWGSTAFGMAVLAVLSLFALHTVFTSQGIGRQSTLSASDTRQLSHTDHLPTASITLEEEKDPITVPKRVVLPAIELGLDVINSSVIVATNYWPLSVGSAHYANFTPGLGSKEGTLLLYGHATRSVLGKTDGLKIGDELVLIDENDRPWKFAFTRQENVTPENVHFIYEDTPFRVVVFTCYGWNNEYRRLMYFSPIYDQNRQ